MMISSSPDSLKDILKAYAIYKDSFKITKRSIKQSDDRLLKRTIFDANAPDEAERLIETSERHIEDFYVVFLWAYFERYVIQYIIKKGNKLKEIYPNALATKLYDKYEKEVEYWRFNDTLDLLKEIIDPGTIGEAKQIKQYRDWLVHRNKPASSSIRPIAAFETLSAIISVLDEN
ncbi:MAG: hypothetical protein HQL03_05550 [Nitrospirae bacterium]|nr:hypothetical protein [Nitrospirota bacterium]MBF0592052.1 hypothetical protein [Nitrospirota bacterium]